MLAVDSDFETVWGWKVCEISETWRKHNKARKLEAGQTRKVTGGPSSGQEIGRHPSPGDSERRTLPSLKSVGLLDSFDNRRTNSDQKSALPPLSKAREW